MSKKFKFKKVCHTKCYKFATLWKPGDVYEGDADPGKHFSDDGEPDAHLPPPGPGSDPRTTAQIREILEKRFNSRKPQSWTRKQLWHALRDYEEKAERDELTNPTEDSNKFPFKTHCGQAVKTKAGVVAHERHCKKCKELKLKVE